jgi:glutathione synthase/RimK-type ligase-like ATP-grasp enzyme
MKKIVFYFGFSVEQWIPFSTFPYKTGTYYALIEALLAQGCECFIAGTRTHYLGRGMFSACRRYNAATHSWELCPATVEADVIFDRTPWLTQFDTIFEQRSVNPLALKVFGNDKFRMLTLFREYTKRFFLVESSADLTEVLKNFSPEDLVVAKPVNGIKGRGIFIEKAHSLPSLLPSLHEPYLLQEFIDTSKGIPNITSTHHDIRFAIANGKIILAALRTPQTGSLLANVAQGGSIEEIPLTALPQSLREQAERIKETLNTLFGPAYYSLDFGVEQGTAYLFEVNDRIGFPRENMPHARLFAQELANALLAKAQ